MGTWNTNRPGITGTYRGSSWGTTASGGPDLTLSETFAALREVDDSFPQQGAAPADAEIAGQTGGPNNYPTTQDAVAAAVILFSFEQ